MTEAHVDLNDLEAIERLDSLNVLGTVENLAGQCLEAYQLAGHAEGLPDPEGVDSIVVLGMGGSGVAGDIAQAVVEPRLPVPFRTVKGYGPLPEWVGRNSLVFAVSYSGNTEETLAAAEEAQERGARLVTVSSGGELAKAAGDLGLAHVRIPQGLQPRASLGYLVIPVLRVLETLGFVSQLEADVGETVRVLEDLRTDCHRDRPAHRNPAKDLAHHLLGRIGLVWGGPGLPAVAAMRFKCDLNEYGKVPAFWNYLPEADHNEVVGWTGLTEVSRELITLVLLRDRDEHPRVARRFDITRHLIERNAADVVEVGSQGTSPLARVLSLVFVTQLAAIYVGLARGVDPGPVEILERLKREMART